MQVKRVKISELKGARYNPKSRSVGSRLKRLVASLTEIGLIYPISVSKDMTIIDGHRRVAAATIVGWDEVPVLINEHDDANKVYAHVNSTGEMMSGLQVLQVYMIEPDAVAAKTRKTIEKWEETFGRPALRRLIRAKLSYNVCAIVMSVCRYVEDETDKFRERCLEYLVEHRCSRYIRAYVNTKQSASRLYKAINSNKVIKTTYTL